MSKETADHNTESRPEWDHLEDWLRGQVQGMVQYMLEEEVTEFLGRLKSARWSDSDSDSGYRNGYAPPRKLTLSSGTIRVRRRGCATPRSSPRAGCCRCSPAGPAGSPI